MIAIGLYFVVMDTVMLAQLFYYKVLKARLLERHSQKVAAASDGATLINDASESDALLSRTDSHDSHSQSRRQSGSSRRSRRASSRRYSGRSRSDSLTVILEETSGSDGRNLVSSILWIGLVLLAGTLGWVIAWRTGAWHSTPVKQNPSDDLGDEPAIIGAEALGYMSSVFYLTYGSLSFSPPFSFSSSFPKAPDHLCTTITSHVLFLTPAIFLKREKPPV